MDAPSPPRTPPRGEEAPDKDAAVVYHNRMFDLSNSARLNIVATEREEVNHERIEVWIKQIGEGRFTVYGLLVAHMLNRVGTIAPMDRSKLDAVILDGGTQVARLLAEEGQWGAVRRTGLRGFGVWMFRAIQNVDVIFRGYTRVMGAVPRVTLVGDEAREVVKLARKTKGLIESVTYVRENLHPLRELQTAPRLLTWKLTFDKDTNDPVVKLADAMSIAINGVLVTAWAYIFPQLNSLPALQRLVDLYGIGFQREALNETVVSFRRLNREFMNVWASKPDPGPGNIDLTSRVDDAMLQGLERPRKRRRRTVRYSYGMARIAEEDAEVALEMAKQHPIFHRGTTLEELRADAFDIEEIGYITTRYTARGILLDPLTGWAASAALNNDGVVLGIDTNALVGLGYYTLAADPIERKIKAAKSWWMSNERDYYLDEEDMSVDEADEVITKRWKEGKNDVVWVADLLNVAYFVFYDDVTYDQYLQTIKTITFWDREGQSNKRAFNAEAVDAAAKELGEE